MMRWMIGALMLLVGAVVGYELMFLLRFFSVVLPHGGMW